MSSETSQSPITDSVAEALKQYGWELGPEFMRRYFTDPWIFNLVNIIEKQLGRMATRCAECFAPFGSFPAPREVHGALVCSGECALGRKQRLSEVNEMGAREADAIADFVLMDADFRGDDEQRRR